MRRARALLIVLAMMATTLVMAGPAGADPPSMETFDVTRVECGFETEFGYAELDPGVELSE